MADRDADMLRTGLSHAQQKKSRAQPKVNTHNPLYQKHFLENLRLAEKVRNAGQVSLDQNGARMDFDMREPNYYDYYEQRPSQRVDSAPSNYTMLSSKPGDVNQE